MPGPTCCETCKDKCAASGKCCGDSCTCGPDCKCASDKAPKESKPCGCGGSAGGKPCSCPEGKCTC